MTPCAVCGQLALVPDGAATATDEPFVCGPCRQFAADLAAELKAELDADDRAEQRDWDYYRLNIADDPDA